MLNTDADKDCFTDITDTNLTHIYIETLYTFTIHS